MSRTFLAEYEVPGIVWATYENIAATSYKEAYRAAKSIAADREWVLAGVMERVDSKPENGSPGPKSLSAMFAM